MRELPKGFSGEPTSVGLRLLRSDCLAMRMAIMHRRTIVFVGLILILCGCHASFSIPPDHRASPALVTTQRVLADMIRTELYFGRSRTDGPPVSDSQWQEFIEE